VTGTEAYLTLAGVACVVGALAAVNTARMALALFLAGTTAVIAAVLALLYALHGNWPGAVANAGVAAFWAWIWWHHGRRRRKRSLRALGNKARARLAAMARNMPRPGPVLRPVPQGARA
jgi:hypothetical protein